MSFFSCLNKFPDFIFDSIATPFWTVPFDKKKQKTSKDLNIPERYQQPEGKGGNLLKIEKARGRGRTFLFAYFSAKYDQRLKLLYILEGGKFQERIYICNTWIYNEISELLSMVIWLMRVEF